ncbi:piggyBac transposable element-derived protein 3-like [Palaemon carinicauda]|uniref:piggyBac transposable element-derived protein 3-like n=1 Tax=Palaemon carinicauda TaxID=392227 RepID=UPI0035B6A9E4
MNTVGYRRPPHDVLDQQQSRPSPTYTRPLLCPNQLPLQPLTDAQQLQLGYYYSKFRAAMKKCVNGFKCPKSIYILTARSYKTNLEEFMTQKCQEVKKEGHRSLTIHDILAILEEDDNHAKVYIEPTDTGLLTDEDSADEDDSGLIDNLSGRQLTGNAEAVFHDGRRTNEDNCEPQLSGNDEAISHDERRTAEDDGAVHSSSPINSYKTPKWSLGTYLTPGDYMFPEANYAKYRDFTPSELCELFFDDDMWNMLVDHTIIYATLKGETDFLVTKGEMKVFIGILIVSGIVPIVPISSRRMFWRNSSVTRNEATYQAMRRRFEKVMQFLHFSDNFKLDTTDKYAKVHPLVRHLTKKFIEHFQPVKSLSHDEAMVEYYGKHRCKQCIRMKPIRFGYKVWCLNSDNGYLVTFDLYQGRTYEGNEVNEKVFGKCAATVLKNIDSLSQDKRSLPYNIYFYNLFTSFQLLTELKDRNYDATWTIRANRCKHCPLKSADSIKKTKETNGRVRYRQGE